MQHEERPQGNSPEVFSQAGYIHVATGKYPQLILENRHQIKALLDAGHKQREIALTIGVHRSTISRELSRNVPNTLGMPLENPTITVQIRPSS